MVLLLSDLHASETVRLEATQGINEYSWDIMLERLAKQSPVGRDAAAELEKEWKRGQSGDLVALTRGVDRLLDEVRR
jgi:hypothetical protein